MERAFFRGAVFSACAGCAVLGLVATLPSNACGDEPAKPVKWLTGEKFKAQIGQKVGVTWAGLPLRRALNSLAHSQQVAIVLDRRIDPEQKIELAFDDIELGSAIKLIAAKRQMGSAIVGSVVYLGPPEAAAKIRTLAALRHDEALHLASDVRRRYLQQRPAKWDEGAEPAELLKALADECKIGINGTDDLPHDLWAAGELPDANFTDRLTLIAAQFGMTFEIAQGGESVRLVKMPDRPSIERNYSLRGIQPPDVAKLLATLKKSLPAATVDAGGGKLVVQGLAEDQDFVESLLSGGKAKTTTVTPGKKVYQFSTVMAVGPLIKGLGSKLGLTVTIDQAAIDAAGLSLKTEVKLDVKNVSEDELLAAVLTPAGLTYQRQGQAITVVPAKKP
jgi:hypothetical protein